ncbi:MAG: hypothetical protein EXR50_02470 [Dehalococcoidia bacterium]|nr:hypothetical protein [Dehalococcoidia bacterium]
MPERLTVVTRKGHITVPLEIRRLLGIKEGDKVSISISDTKAGEAVLRPVHSVAELTFGAINPRKRPEDLKELRELVIEEIAEQVAREGGLSLAV